MRGRELPQLSHEEKNWYRVTSATLRGSLMEMNMVEILGYAASIMVAISLTMKDIVRLRVLNFIGCGLFTAYGLMIDSMPVVITNGFIACVNIYFLVKMQQEKKTQTLENAA
ncbi:YgjV family protein [Vibrio genomosp. F10]|nr:YgjV family protein [Vibrio genomosp. F10]